MSFGLDQYFKREKAKKKKKPETKKPAKVAKPEEPVDQDWPWILEETVQSMILYPHLLDYTRTNILPKHPTITPEELKIQLRIPLGVAIVLLKRLQREINASE